MRSCLASFLLLLTCGACNNDGLSLDSGADSLVGTWVGPSPVGGTFKQTLVFTASGDYRETDEAYPAATLEEIDPLNVSGFKFRGTYTAMGETVTIDGRDGLYPSGYGLTVELDADFEIHGDVLGEYLLHPDGSAQGFVGTWRGAWAQRWKSTVIGDQLLSSSLSLRVNANGTAQRTVVGTVTSGMQHSGETDVWNGTWTATGSGMLITWTSNVPQPGADPSQTPNTPAPETFVPMPSGALAAQAFTRVR